jgi:hypothetical protein
MIPVDSACTCPARCIRVVASVLVEFGREYITFFELYNRHHGLSILLTTKGILNTYISNSAGHDQDARNLVRVQ